MENFTDYFAALAPSIGLFLLFWLLMRSILRADRSERAAQQRAREEQQQASDGRRHGPVDEQF